MIRTRDLVHVASDAAFAIDEKLTVVAWNDGARALLGYTAQEAIGQPCYGVLRAVLPSGEPLCTPMCEASLCFGRCQPFAAQSCHARHKDGSRVPVSISTLVVPQEAKCAGATQAVIFLRAHEDIQSRPLPEQPLRIFTLGRFGLAAQGRGIDVEKWRRKQSLTLLKYLVTQLGRAVHRERLIESMWPEAEAEQGRERLKVTVYFLRRQLRTCGVRENILETVGPAYLLRREAVWVDAEAFEKLIAEGSSHQRRNRPDEALRCYEEAQCIYRGDFLEEELYADWCAEERERLRELYLEVLARLGECYGARGDHARAAQVCRTALVREPCRESFHRALMEYLVRLDRPDWAVAQYSRCRRTLMDELGVEPMPETLRLYRQIVEATKTGGQKRALKP